MRQVGNILNFSSHHIPQCSLLYLKSEVELYTEYIMERFMEGVALNLVIFEGM